MSNVKSVVHAGVAPPRATYRLQLNQDFTFAHATALLPYLEALGISHVYLSPILMAQPGSRHGYDTVDHTRLNPELGTIADFKTLARTLRARRMGIILDFVPNHMGVGGAQNGLWLDVLKHGAASRFADWFDIDWHPPRPGMSGKLLVPFLGNSFIQSLTAGDLALKADGGGFAVWAYDAEKLPIRDQDTDALLKRYGTAEAALIAHTGKKGNVESWATLDSLIGLQHWRLAHFSVAADEINYRRFFVNSELAGIRIDKPEVFDHAHGLIFSLIEEELVDGLRIDHVDGLLDPKGYLETLRSKSPRPIYLAIEKILAPHEQLRADWPVDGTTGYEVGAQLTRLLMQASAEGALTSLYADIVGPVACPAQEAYSCKLRVMDHELAAELAALSRQLAQLAWSVGETADVTEPGLRRVLREVIAHLSVYRTYVDHDGPNARDRREIALAMAHARRAQPQIQPMTFAFVEQVICGGLGPGYDPKAVAAVIGRIQQYSGPVMAKGLEDTALYRYNRLVALNEVGAHPDRFALSIAAFHDANRRRLASHPNSMIGTSTHDTKRGEDTRALIAAIADAPDDWAAAVAEWRGLLSAAGHDLMHANDLYLLFQLIVGGWPIAGDPLALPDRLKAAMEKSLREGRQRSDWGVNDRRYEERVAVLIDTIFADTDLLASFARHIAPLHRIGRRKAMIQAALKLTIPGIPDIYRGAEDWEQSFVDPDNRRPLDFPSLARRLAEPLEGRDDKMVLTQRLLHLRRRMPDLFAQGSYEPIGCGVDTIGFCRKHGAHQVVVLADLSSGNALRLLAVSRLPTIHGGPDGPVWICAR